MDKVIFGRILVVLAGAIWLGGLTFYASVVIPMAHTVLGSHTTVGFITQRVTGWINVMGAVALIVFFANIFAMRANHRRWLGISLWATWAVMVATQVGLFFLRPMLGRLLDFEMLEVIDPERFYRLHQVYLIGTSVQLLAGLIFLAGLLAVWRRQDMMAVERGSCESLQRPLTQP